MKRVFIDTNVFIDYVAHRGDFYEPAATIVSLAEKRTFRLLVSSLSFATGSYILESHYGKHPNEILQSYSEFVSLCRVTTVSEAIIKKAIAYPFDDFEDAMQYHTALSEGADCIITRDKKHFALSKEPVMTPVEFLDMLTK